MKAFSAYYFNVVIPVMDKQCTMTAPSNTLQLNVSGGVDSCSVSRHSSVQTLCLANKVCRILTMREERIELHEKRILPNPLHGSALRYTTDQRHIIFKSFNLLSLLRLNLWTRFPEECWLV